MSIAQNDFQSSIADYVNPGGRIGGKDKVLRENVRRQSVQRIARERQARSSGGTFDFARSAAASATPSSHPSSVAASRASAGNRLERMGYKSIFCLPIYVSPAAIAALSDGLPEDSLSAIIPLLET